jgi:hypothetical protein
MTFVYTVCGLCAFSPLRANSRTLGFSVGFVRAISSSYILARHAGLLPSIVSAMSLRVSGACALTAAGWGFDRLRVFGDGGQTLFCVIFVLLWSRSTTLLLRSTGLLVVSVLLGLAVENVVV